MAKSLLTFIKEDSIKKEVDTWSLKDCAEYMEEHLNDKVIFPKNTLEIVGKKLKSLFNNSRPEERKNVFKNWKFSPNLLSYLKKYIKYPNNFFDENYSDLKDCPHKNTGIYLWFIGYKIDRYLGSGTFGCVWECNGKAVKVVTDGYCLKDEVISAKMLAELINKDTTGKAKKYFNQIISQGDKSPVLEATLANMDLRKKSMERSSSGRAEEKKNNKTIESTLRMGRQVCKALITLHNLGYSHNDVKPANLLSVDKSIVDANKANKVSKDGKVHKHRTQLADFGSITKIPEGKKDEIIQWWNGTSYTAKYYPDDMKSNFKKEAIEKRDVFALAASIFWVLINKVSGKDIDPKTIIKFKNEEIYDYFKLGEYYGGTSEKNMFSLLDAIRKMMNQSYTSRPTLEESLTLIKNINGGK